MEDMPDPYVARESIWLPFMKETLGAHSESILIGHSSGSEAILRYLETNRVKGAFLVSACHTDLGDSNERASGYYSRPWEWETIRTNAEYIVQIHALDDHLIPVDEARHVADHVESEYIELPTGDHFMCRSFPFLLETVLKKALKTE
jgi:predicted alpha/beta hydrolase family esterase